MPMMPYFLKARLYLIYYLIYGIHHPMSPNTVNMHQNYQRQYSLGIVVPLLPKRDEYSTLLVCKPTSLDYSKNVCRFAFKIHRENHICQNLPTLCVVRVTIASSRYLRSHSGLGVTPGGDFSHLNMTQSYHGTLLW
jgi:hypothetical protein